MLSKKLFWLLLFSSFISYTNTYGQSLPDLGANEQAAISSKEENLIGQTYMQYLRHENLVSTDSVINSYLSKLGNKLAIASGAKSQKFTFFAVNADDINAYAFFGGNVGVYLGLVSSTSNESELAAVIAHEISHINQKHLNRQIAEHKKLLPLTLAGVVGAMAIGNSGVGMAALANHAQQMINFTREHEKEADYLGMQALYNAGFDPEGMPNIFASMQSDNKYQLQAPEYLLTHPLYEARIADAKNRAHQFPYIQTNTSLNYYLVKARASMLIKKDLTGLEKSLVLQLKEGRYSSKAAVEYAYALCLVKLHNGAAALKILLALAKEYPENLIINLSLAELQAARQDSNASLKILQSLYELYPDESAVLLSFAENLLLFNKASLAKNLLIKQTTLFTEEPQGFELLAQTEHRLGNICQMHLAKARWAVLNGELDNAILQVDLALQSTKDLPTRNKLQQEKQRIETLMQEQKNL